MEAYGLETENYQAGQYNERGQTSGRDKHYEIINSYEVSLEKRKKAPRIGIERFDEDYNDE